MAAGGKGNGMLVSAAVPGGAKPSSGMSALQSWLPTLLMNIILPTVTFFLLTTAVQVADVPALVLSGSWPAMELGYTIWRQRHVDEFSVFILLLLAISIITTVFSLDARAVFLKDWIAWGLFGLAILVSMLFQRPLMFYSGRRFATDGSRAQRDWWGGLWRFPHFRRSQRLLNVVWGLTLVIESVVGGLLTWTLGTSAMVLVNNILPYVVLTVLIFGTIRYGRRARAAAARRVAAVAAGPTGAATEPVQGA